MPGTAHDPSAAGSGDIEDIERLPPYPHYAELRGRHVFVSGGGSGLGAYFVDAFASQGAKVSFVSLAGDPGEQLCDSVARRHGVRPRFEICDLRDLAAVKITLDTLIRAIGPVRVLINNAARDDRHKLADMDAAAWDDSFSTNLRPYFFTARQLVPDMRDAGGGSIINLGSNSANLGLAGYPAYVTAKAAIVGLTRALARELGTAAIRVNTLVPGWVMTYKQRTLRVTPADHAQCLAEQCLKRELVGRDIAAAALFLASDSAAMITGQSLLVDGGRAN